MEAADSDQGPFSDHLRHHLFNIKQFEDLCTALKAVIQMKKCNDPILANRLSAAGLTKGTPPDKVEITCGLYEAYFKNKL